MRYADDHPHPRPLTKEHSSILRVRSYLDENYAQNISLAQLAEIRSATWFSKPTGMSYDRLYELLHENRVEQQGIVWQRQMTMGPALEFCLHSSQKSLLVEEIKSVQVEVQLLFISGR